MNRKILFSFICALCIAGALLLALHIFGPGLVEQHPEAGGEGRAFSASDAFTGDGDAGGRAAGRPQGVRGGSTASQRKSRTGGVRFGGSDGGRRSSGGASSTAADADLTDGGSAAAAGGAAGKAPGGGLSPFSETGPGVLQVEVLDGEGEYYPGAKVRLSSSYGDMEQVTNEQGFAAFDRLPAGRYTLSVDSDEGFQGKTQAVKLEQGGQRKITLHLSTGDHTVSGRALDTEGNTLTGVEVSLAPAPLQGEVAYLWRHEEEILKTTTDRSGFYNFEGLSSGTYTLTAEWAETGEQKRRNVSPPSKDEDLVFHVPFVVEIHGVCTDPDNMPVEAATVSVLGRNVVSTLTDARGEYRLLTKSLSWSGTIYVRAQKNGYKRSDERVGLSENNTARQLQVDFILEPNTGTGEISGFLLNQESEGVPQETILLVSSSNKLQKHARSGADGGFLFKELEPGDDYRLSVFPDRLYKDLRKTGLRLEEGRHLEVELVLEPIEVGTLTGMLYDAERSPLRGYTFRVRSNKSWSHDINVVTASDGSFRKEEVPAGSLIFDTQASPHYSVRGAELAPGEEKDVTIVFGAGAEEVEGLVRDKQESSIAGAKVILSWIRKDGALTSTVQHSTVTDQTGWFRFTGLASGSYRVQVQAGGFKTAHESKTLSISGVRTEWNFELQK